MPPLVWIAMAWLAGLFAARQWLVPAGVRPETLLLLGVLPLAAILLWRKDRSMRLGGVCALALLAGALRCQAVLPDPNDSHAIAAYNDHGWVTVEGTVDDYPDLRDTWTNLKLDATRVEAGSQVYDVRGLVLVRAPSFPAYHYGDRLRVSGRLETPTDFEGFAYRDYLARQGIYSLMARPQVEFVSGGQGKLFWRVLLAVKDRARAVIARLLPDPEAALLQGIVLGVESGIPAALYDAYNATGTSHIIVISGSNITIVSALLAAAFGRLLGKRRAYWFVVTGIVLYVLLVGADSAVVRAGVMGALYVTALFLGRQATAYTSLLASAVFLTAFKPLALWDPGFQLSFAATLGLILFTPAIQQLFERGLTHFVAQERAQKVVRYANDVLIVTLAAQILTIPLIVYHFGRLSLAAPLANFLILPVQPPIMTLGGAATLAGLLPGLEPVARVIAWVPWLCLAYTNAVVRWLAAWPAASLQIGQAGIGRLLLYYGIIVGLAWGLPQRRAHLRRLWRWLTARPAGSTLLGICLAAAILIWLAVLQLPDGRLHVAFLDVGQGDAILITSPQGRQILVDGGPSPTALTSALGRHMPFWDRSLDLVVMTHPDADHITGLAEVLARYQVGSWLDNGRDGDDALFAACLARLAAAGTTRQAVQSGQRLDLGDGLWLEVLHPPPGAAGRSGADTNNDSVVLRLSWKQASFLLTGDLEAEAEQVLLQSGQPLSSTVLKVAHHGSGGSSTAAFLAAVDPRFAVISVGADNKFGHPDPAVLERLAVLGHTQVLRTDESGTIEFITDGQEMQVRTER